MFTSGKLNGCSLKVCFDKVFGNYDKICNVIQTLCRFYLVTHWNLNEQFKLSLGEYLYFHKNYETGFVGKKKAFLKKHP